MKRIFTPYTVANCCTRFTLFDRGIVMSLKKSKAVVYTHRQKQMEGDPYSFAHGLNFYKLFLIFMVGSVIGYVVETLFCFFVEGFFESRKGLLYGPFIPVYGFGAVLMTLVLYRYRNRSSTVVFLVAAFLGAAFEFFCSWFQEVVFGTVSWEYSDSAFNLQGRTNVFFAICWGVMGLVFINYTLPFLTELIEKIPNRIGVCISWVLLVFMVFDILISSIAVKRQEMRQEGYPATNAFVAFIDHTYTDEYLKQVFPNMQPADEKYNKEYSNQFNPQNYL